MHVGVVVRIENDSQYAVLDQNSDLRTFSDSQLAPVRQHGRGGGMASAAEIITDSSGNLINVGDLVRSVDGEVGRSVYACVRV